MSAPTLALDVGTTRIRALVVDAHGVPTSSAHLDAPLSAPSAGRVEQDAATLLERARAVLSSALAEARLGAADVAGLGITAQRLKTLGLVDKVVNEPLGGAHRDPQAAAQALKKALAEAFRELRSTKPKQLVEARLERLMGYGKFKEAAER